MSVRQLFQKFLGATSTSSGTANAATLSMLSPLASGTSWQHVLPIDAWYVILQHVPRKQRFLFAGVCKHWHRLVWLDVKLVRLPGKSRKPAVMTPLHAAAARGMHHVCRLLVDDARHDVNAREKRLGGTPLAAGAKHLSVVQVLLARGADPNMTFGVIAPATSKAPLHWREWTALHLAAYRGAIPQLRALVAAKANLNALSADGCTPLYLAISTAQTEAVEELLRAGANPNCGASQSLFGAGPVYAACAYGKGPPRLMQLLLEFGGDPNSAVANGTTALMRAVHGGQIERVRLLLSAGADVHRRRPSDGSSAIHLAALQKHKQPRWPTMALLLAAGAASDVNARTNAGYTPLFLAAQTAGNAALIYLLLEAGADPSIACGVAGGIARTPLQKAQQMKARDNIVALTPQPTSLLSQFISPLTRDERARARAHIEDARVALCTVPPFRRSTAAATTTDPPPSTEPAASSSSAASPEAGQPLNASSSEPPPTEQTFGALRDADAAPDPEALEGLSASADALEALDYDAVAAAMTASSAGVTTRIGLVSSFAGPSTSASATAAAAAAAAAAASSSPSTWPAHFSDDAASPTGAAGDDTHDVHDDDDDDDNSSSARSANDASDINDDSSEDLRALVRI